MDDDDDDDEGQPGDIRTDDREAGTGVGATSATGVRPTRSFREHGFLWRTGDEEFELQFHDETQLDIRAH